MTELANITNPHAHWGLLTEQGMTIVLVFGHVGMLMD
jgi:hypothetical protein